MPSKSPAQARTMAAIAHGWKPTGKAKGIPRKVAEEYNKEDTGTKMLSEGLRRRKRRKHEKDDEED